MPAISAPGAERVRLDVEIERVRVRVEGAERLRGWTGALEMSPAEERAVR